MKRASPPTQSQAVLYLSAIRDPDRHHRAAAIRALGERTQRAEFSQPPRPIINAFAQAAKDPEPAVVGTVAAATQQLIDHGITDNHRRTIATAMLANTRVPDRAVSMHAHAIATTAVGLNDLIPRFQTYLATTARPTLAPGEADRYLAIIRGRTPSP